MIVDFHNIHIGSFIREKVENEGLDIERITKFMNCSPKEISMMYECAHLPADILLRWSKLLEYDFFRLYSQHLILYAPPKKAGNSTIKNKPTTLPQFRKNIYTKEVIHFILELIDSNKKTKAQIIEEYRIPKTTLYKWMVKYKNTA